MAYSGRALPSHIRSQSSSLGGSQPAAQSPVLLARIAEKKAELASLKDLQALSAGLADQMQTLAEKLTTLSDGTEGKLPKPKEDEDAENKSETEPPLPQTLVRIPTQHAPAVLPQANPAE
ncbi:DASH complex subunit dad2 [Kalmusia sp. IMI 367209]|nr:DASH complex subunit dad2 [Kalmusia sp. IMI 367209]